MLRVVYGRNICTKDAHTSFLVAALFKIPLYKSRN